MTAEELWEIVKLEDELQLVLALRQGADINGRRRSNSAPLIVQAAFEGRWGIVKMLIEHGADINAADKVDATILHYAVSKGNLEMTKYILEKTPKLSEKQEFQLVHRAIQRGKEAILEEILKAGASPSEKHTFTEEYALDTTIMEGSFESLQLLIKYGANPYQLKYRSNFCLEFLTTDVADLDMCKKLLDLGVSPTHVAEDSSPLEKLIAHRNISFANLFAKYPMNTGAKGHPAFVDSVLQGNIDSMELFIESGFDLDTKINGTDIIDYIKSLPEYNSVEMADNMAILLELKERYDNDVEYER